MDNPGKIKLKIYYFTLEMSKDDKYQQFLSFILFMNSGFKTRLSPLDLRSTDERKPLDEAVFGQLEDFKNTKFQDAFDQCVEFIEDKRTPSEVKSFFDKVALSKGQMTYKDVEIVNEETGEVTIEKVEDRFVPHNENEYVIGVFDHMSLVESDAGERLRDSMATLSKHFNMIRNKYKFTMVAIQQQAADKEGLDAFKMGRLKPSADGLADNKALARDYVMMFGIFSPFKNDMQEYYGYDIAFFKDNIRFLEVIINREGSAGSTAPLMFDGAVNFFRELPKPDDIVSLSRFKDFVRQIRGEINTAFFMHARVRKENGFISRVLNYINKALLWVLS